jgi:predicted DNA-binding transcriptional regulator AlpA
MDWTGNILEKPAMGDIARSHIRRHDDPCRVYRAKELSELLGVHPISVWRWARNGRLPKPIKLGPGTTVWRARDIELWLDQKAKPVAIE